MRQGRYHSGPWEVKTISEAESLGMPVLALSEEIVGVNGRPVRDMKMPATSIYQAHR
jgi:hypothetical protein